MRPLNDTIIPAQAAASVNSSAVSGQFLIYLSAQIVSTGAGAAGTLKIQVSNDPVEVSGNPVNWSDLSGASVVVAGAGAFLIPKVEICYRWFRCVYTNTGTGTIQVNINALGN